MYSCVANFSIFVRDMELATNNIDKHLPNCLNVFELTMKRKDNEVQIKDKEEINFIPKTFLYPFLIEFGFRFIFFLNSTTNICDFL